LFVQQTVVPGATVKVVGEKLKSTIETCVALLSHDPVAAWETEARPPGRTRTSAAATNAVSLCSAFTPVATTAARIRF
jgi:hypothetical protein